MKKDVMIVTGAGQISMAIARPAYQKDELPDLSQYSTVFIGAPVWWGDW